LWDMGEPEDRQGMAHTLFTHVVYNLDTRRIEDFQLKPWADRFLVLRASLYGDDDDNTPSGAAPADDSPKDGGGGTGGGGYAPGRIRTADARFRRPALYPLSYGSM
jgi:hypothetical protein